jgi:hypothetical protein
MNRQFSLFLFAFILTLCSFVPTPIEAQNVRAAIAFPSITSQYTTPFLVANVAPNLPLLAVCNFPANNLPCTNYATTYTSAGSACPNGSQDTPDPQPSACQSSGDAQGNLGFWAAPGKYSYTVCIQSTTSCFGPYAITLSLADTSGTCTMTAGQCAAITFAAAYATTPSCTVTWTGTGTLTGFLSSQRSSSGLRPKSSVNSDTAVVDWKCQGNPN